MFNEFVDAARPVFHKLMGFARYQHPEYPLVGLTEEVGEYEGICAKLMRKHGNEWLDYRDDEIKRRLKSELGDVLWFVAANCEMHGFDLAEIIVDLHKKLDDRQNRGVIVGEGDDR